MFLAQWQNLMQRLSIVDATPMYEKLMQLYAEKHRHYHNFSHIKACLSLLEAHKNLAQSADEIELALWFHDAIYAVFSSHNEEDSALLAKEFLSRAHVDNAIIERVVALILATQHNTPLDNNDQALMVDIDLAILGTTPDIYQIFEKNVRKEYQKIPWFLYKKGRRKILQSFLDKPRIYHLPVFQQDFEAQARVNIQQALENL